MKKGMIIDHRKLNRCIEIIGWSRLEAAYQLRIPETSLKNYKYEDTMVSVDRFNHIERSIEEAMARFVVSEPIAHKIKY